MAEEKATNVSQIEDDDELDEEPGEVIESAPPLKVGEEREINSIGLKKKLLKQGIGWDTPEIGDEVSVHYVGTLLDGTKFSSTRDRGEPLDIKIGCGQVVNGVDQGILTMKKGEVALFTLPPELGYGTSGTNSVPPNSVTQHEIELISWIRVVDVSKDGAIIKKIMEQGQSTERPGELDEVSVKYKVMLVDDTVVAKSPEGGVQFYVKDGHFCPALSKAIKTMGRGEKVNLVVQPQYAFGDEGKNANSEFPPIPPSSVLSIELELLSFNHVIDVTGDSKVFKKILKEGEGALTANEGATVTLRYLGMLQNGSVFEKKGFDGQEPLQFITDEEQVVAGLDRAAATMKKGEFAILTISPEYGFGSMEVQRDLALVPPSSTIVYEVEMLEFTKEKEPWEMSKQEKIEACSRKKEEGNMLFKDGKYQRAAKKYDKAVTYATDDGSFGDDDLKLIKALRVSCWLNAAACNLKLNDFRRTIEFCSKVLDIEFYNVKALYRRAQAYMETADFYLAQLDINKALEADPQNREVKLILKNLKQRQAECNKRESKLFAKMFACMSKDSSMARKRMKVEKVEEEEANRRRMREEEEKEVMTMEMEKVAVTSDLPQPQDHNNNNNSMLVD